MASTSGAASSTTDAGVAPHVSNSAGSAVKFINQIRSLSDARRTGSFAATATRTKREVELT